MREHPLKMVGKRASRKSDSHRVFGQGRSVGQSKDCAMGSIFFSYARGDDEEFVWRLYERLKAAGFGVWFDRVSMPSRDLTFYQEIRDAIAACDHLVLVVGPQASGSDYVAQEWRF